MHESPLQVGEGAVNTGPSREYAHRQNTDGTFDSICLSCFLTVSSANSEFELAEAETQHSCQAGDVLVAREFNQNAGT
jgi:hypothetical protein